MDEYFSQRPQLDPIAIAEEMAELRAGASPDDPTSKSTSGAVNVNSQAPPPPTGRNPVVSTEEARPAEEGDPDAVMYAEAIYAYPKNEADDLELAKGERLVLLERISDDWWRGRSMDGKRREGIVPSAYVQELR
ncbi:hypothetical protein K437DRAFT_254648 [Tilletiaria anomala UBC 951]|uniref:SH3 domain-containing protein n=1 Tax=Tilletiaria anomala (strain ATCC 24038 / CBS 436.72 / UBC 951) TaxID=1037660 RepID=A0A066WN86_TILAU|nr:uncharacterized protein K437DRAFT_254648 [Tilletiaria anomala UBC 951]KDN52090.1 hypothetical protein K437DRAFT_254648 [Tilletiaria anomala UBC 951]